MAFYREEYSFHKTALSDLQGSWSNLREEVVNLHPFENSERLLFQIDEAMSWESVNNLNHMGSIILLIHNIVVRSRAPEQIIEWLQQVQEDFDAVLEDIGNGTIAFQPTKTKQGTKRQSLPPDRLSEREREKYTENSTVINWQHPEVVQYSAEILSKSNGEFDYIKNVFEYVRDTISHSHDFQTKVVTCTASEVLQHKTGSCYAKSHLLAALLRAQKIPVGFCYQRLSLEENGPPYCLHGLNAIFLKEYNWYRIDARGNKEGVDARFTPPVEQLAFPVTEPQERNLPEIWSEPLPVIVQALQTHRTVEELYNNLPDIRLM